MKGRRAETRLGLRRGHMAAGQRCEQAWALRRCAAAAALVAAAMGILALACDVGGAAERHIPDPDEDVADKNADAKKTE